jgi:hypothetical protein
MMHSLEGKLDAVTELGSDAGLQGEFLSGGDL